MDLKLFNSIECFFIRKLEFNITVNRDVYTKNYLKVRGYLEFLS